MYFWAYPIAHAHYYLGAWLWVATTTTHGPSTSGMDEERSGSLKVDSSESGGGLKASGDPDEVEAKRDSSGSEKVEGGDGGAGSGPGAGTGPSGGSDPRDSKIDLSTVGAAEMSSGGVAEREASAGGGTGNDPQEASTDDTVGTDELTSGDGTDQQETDDGSSETEYTTTYGTGYTTTTGDTTIDGTGSIDKDSPEKKQGVLLGTAGDRMARSSDPGPKTILALKKQEKEEEKRLREEELAREAAVSPDITTLPGYLPWEEDLEMLSSYQDRKVLQ